MADDKFLEEYFKTRAKELINLHQNIEDIGNNSFMFQDLTYDDYIKTKNQLYINLTDTKVRNHLLNVHRRIASQKKNKDWRHYKNQLKKFDQVQKERELNLDDATNIAIKRLNFFTEVSKSFLRDKTPAERRNIRAWYNYQLEASNYVGQFALNGQMERDFVVSATSDRVDWLIKKRLIPKGSEEGIYHFLLVFPVNADYPYTIIEKLDEGHNYDPTSPSRSFSEKTYDKLKNSNPVNFWDVASWISMMNDEFDTTNHYKVDLVDISTPQKRLKFVRQYIAGLSQNAMAQIIKDEYGVKADQKKIDYWEKTDSDFPPFLKEDNLEISAEIFAEKGKNLLSYELRDNIAKDLVSKSDIINWIKFFIKENPIDVMIYDVPDFIARTCDLNVEVSGSEMNIYKDALRRYEMAERTDNNAKILKTEEINTQILQNWFGVLNQISEKEIIQDMQLVYDNDKIRSKVFSLWREFRIFVPLTMEIREKEPRNHQELSPKPPFDN